MTTNLNLEFAKSLISLTLTRGRRVVRPEYRGEEVMLHVYPEKAELLAEAEFFVRVQHFEAAEDAVTARQSMAQVQLYGRPTYVAQVIGDGSTVAVSSELAAYMRHTVRDFEQLETF